MTPKPRLATPAVAVIARTKNRPAMLRRAMGSVLAQVREDWMMVVVNDGGDPSEVAAVTQEFESRFRGRLCVVDHPESKGMEAATNSGIAASTSEFITILDDDDTWEPTFLDATLGLLELPSGKDYGGVVTGSTKVVERIEGDEIVEESREDATHLLADLSLWRMCGRNLFPTNAFVYRRLCLDAVGRYREDLPVLGDWEFNIRFLRHFDIAPIRHQRLANFHHRSGGAASYSNSFDTHDTWRTKLRNEWLRQDMEEGKLGLGFMANLSGQLAEIEDRAGDMHKLIQPLHSVASRLEGLKRKFGKGRA